jgi:hypothetical protein
VPEVELDDLRFGGDCHESCLSEIAREIYNGVNHIEKVSSRVSCFGLPEMFQEPSADQPTPSSRSLTTNAQLIGINIEPIPCRLICNPIQFIWNRLPNLSQQRPFRLESISNSREIDF